MAEDYDLETEACPHCGGTTRIEAHTTMHWVCAACGGPRIPTPRLSGKSVIATHDDASRALVEARQATLGASQARARAWLLAVVAASVASAGAVALGSSFGIAVAFFAVSAIALVSAMSQRFDVMKRTNEATAKRESAWAHATMTVLAASSHEMTAAELATAMRIREVTAEALLSSLAVHDRTRIAIGADAELRYSTTDNSHVDESVEASTSSGPHADDSTREAR
jgi:ribosomal protein S27AE